MSNDKHNEATNANDPVLTVTVELPDPKTGLVAKQYRRYRLSEFADERAVADFRDALRKVMEK